MFRTRPADASATGEVCAAKGLDRAKLRRVLIELQATSNIVFFVEEGVIDEASVLAFVGGQCHGLALALRARTGYPLAAVFDRDSVCVHVCVRTDNGLLLDITGVHLERTLTAGGDYSVRIVEPVFLAELVSEHGWAPPDVSAASAWVEPVLRQAADGATKPAMRSDTMRWSHQIDDDLELCIKWAGEAHMDAYVRSRRDSAGDWTLYSHVAFPPDEDGLYRIEFTAQRFAALAEAWVERQFDRFKAEQKLAAAGG